MTNRQFERLVTNLRDIMHCPHCSATYSMPDVHYLGQMENMTFLHMRCEDCHTPVFASVALADQNGELILGDIVADDIAVTPGQDMQSPEDILDSYEPEYNDIELGFERKQLDIDPYAFEPTRVDIPVTPQITAEEIMARLNPVSYDDVLDLHQFLDRHTGTFDFLAESKS